MKLLERQHLVSGPSTNDVCSVALPEERSLGEKIMTSRDFDRKVCGSVNMGQNHTTGGRIILWSLCNLGTWYTSRLPLEQALVMVALLGTLPNPMSPHTCSPKRTNPLDSNLAFLGEVLILLGKWNCRWTNIDISSLTPQATSFSSAASAVTGHKQRKHGKSWLTGLSWENLSKPMVFVLHWKS